MLGDIESVKEFLVGEIKELNLEIALCHQQNTEIPLLDKGILTGKGLAYERVVEFIYDMEQSQKEKK